MPIFNSQTSTILA